MDTIGDILASPLIGALGGLGGIVGILWLVSWVQRHLVGPLSDENLRLRQRLDHAETQADAKDVAIDRMRAESVECAEERQAMRIAFRIHGVPWDPEVWRK